MSRKNRSRKTLKANIYENDYEELIYSTSPETKIKHVEKPARKTREKSVDKKPASSQSSKQQTEATRNELFGEAISKKTVSCKCNKCSAQVTGTLVSMIYTAFSNMMTPFVSYHCDACSHTGHRSVKEKSLPAAEFERFYF